MAIALAMTVAAVIVVVTADDSGSSAGNVSELQADDGGGSSAGALGAIAAFGLPLVWIVGGGVMLYRTQRRRRETAAGP